MAQYTIDENRSNTTPEDKQLARCLLQTNNIILSVLVSWIDLFSNFGIKMIAEAKQPARCLLQTSNIIPSGPESTSVI